MPGLSTRVAQMMARMAPRAESETADVRAAAVGTATGNDGGAGPASAADGVRAGGKGQPSVGCDFPPPMLGEAGSYSKERPMFAVSVGRMQLARRAAAAQRATAATPQREDGGGSKSADLPETGAAGDTGLGAHVEGGAAGATHVPGDGGGGAAAADAGAEVFEDAVEDWEAGGEPGVDDEPEDQPQAAAHYEDRLSLGECQVGDGPVEFPGVADHRRCWGELRFWWPDTILELVALPEFEKMSDGGRKEAFAAAVDAAGGVPWANPLAISIAEPGALARGSVSRAVLKSKGMVITGDMLRDPGRGCAARLLAFAWASSGEHAPQMASLSTAVVRMGADALMAQLAAKAGCGIGDRRLRMLGEHAADACDSTLPASTRDAAYAQALRGHGFAAAADWVAGAGGQALRSLGNSGGLFGTLQSLYQRTQGTVPWEGVPRD
jgi:hypothetical protein